MSARQLGLLAAAALAAACGGTSSSPVQPAPVPTSSAPNSAATRAFNMRLEAQLNLATLGATAGSGNWGYTAPDGRRFALTGLNTGLSIVDVTNPASPRSVGLISGPSSSWREVKTYRQYAYVTTEARPHGVDIIDLSDPDRPVKVRTWDTTLSSAHSIWIDVDKGLAFVNGTRTATGQSNGMRILSLEPDPTNPREVGSYSNSYVHDSYSRGNVLYASAINDGAEVLLDVTDARSPRELTSFFTGGRFTHNSWLTGDGRYLFTTDERPGRPLEGWDLSNPMAPRKVSEYIGNPSAIPHNVMIDGTRLVVSHYTEGVHMLDVSNPERPQLLGFYDTFEGPSGGFFGAWGAYIFPGTDLIVVSDINGGLFVVRYVRP
jgi:choice-of-anchor B domain-containing protein